MTDQPPISAIYLRMWKCAMQAKFRQLTVRHQVDLLFHALELHRDDDAVCGAVCQFIGLLRIDATAAAEFLEWWLIENGPGDAVTAREHAQIVERYEWQDRADAGDG